MNKPWGAIDPNSDHQLWSHWTFRVVGGRVVPMKDVRENTASWLRCKFGSVGQAKVSLDAVGAYIIEARVEGVDAHDPGVATSVRKDFASFVSQGWGPLAIGGVTVKILAGDLQDGQPRQQLVVLDGRLGG